MGKGEDDVVKEMIVGLLRREVEGKKRERMSRKVDFAVSGDPSRDP